MATRIERRHYKFLKATSKRMVMGPFECPNCGFELYFRREAGSEKVQAKCQCGLTGEWPYSEVLQPVDYYNKLTDELRNTTERPKAITMWMTLIQNASQKRAKS